MSHWRGQENSTPPEQQDRFMAVQIITQLARLESRASRPTRCLEWLGVLKKTTKNPDEIQKRIGEVKAASRLRRRKSRGRELAGRTDGAGGEDNTEGCRVRGRGRKLEPGNHRGQFAGGEPLHPKFWSVHGARFQNILEPRAGRKQAPLRTAR